MVENVMSHYENMKEKEDRKRVLNMNMSLAAFVDPEHHVRKQKRKHASQTRSKPHGVPLPATPGHEELTGSPGRSKGHKGMASDESLRSFKSSDGSDAKSDDSDSAQSWRRVEEDDHTDTFRRAANLLLNSLSLDAGGGALFLDTATSYRSVSFNLLICQGNCTD